MLCTLNGTSPASLIAIGVANAFAPRPMRGEVAAKDVDPASQSVGGVQLGLSLVDGQPGVDGARSGSLDESVASPFQAEMVPFKLAKMKRASLRPPALPLPGMTRCLHWRPGPSDLAVQWPLSECDEAAWWIYVHLS